MTDPCDLIVESTSLRVPIVSTHRVFEDSGAPFDPDKIDGTLLLFDFDLPTWEPDHLHWVAPSKVKIFTKHIEATAHHLSNMRRTGGIFDTGGYYNAIIEIGFCETETSPPFSSMGYVMAGLGYQRTAWNVAHRWDVPGLMSVLKDRANWCSITQKWSTGVPPPPDWTVPPVPIPGIGT